MFSPVVVLDMCFFLCLSFMVSVLTYLFCRVMLAHTKVCCGASYVVEFICLVLGIVLWSGLRSFGSNLGVLSAFVLCWCVCFSLVFLFSVFVYSIGNAMCPLWMLEDRVGW